MLITPNGGDELLLLRALLRATDYGVLLSDRDRRDLVCNRRFCELFGLDERDVIGSPPGHLASRVMPRLENAEEFAGLLEAIYANPELVRDDEVRLVAPRARLLRRHTGPVRNESGEVIGRIWTFFDITATRKLEERVKAQAALLKVQARQLASSLKTVSHKLHDVEDTLGATQQQLFESEKLSAVGLLAASVAHDIRNILTPINIELSLADADDAAARGESLRTVQQQVDKMSQLTQKLLALAKPTAQRLVEVDLGELAERVLAQVRPQALLDGIDVAYSAPKRLPTVCADSVQIERVLVNLVLNGVQAMERDGGRLAMRLRRQSRNGRDGVAISVEDSGPGMPLDVRRRLFDPFVTTRPDGTGLGLFSCRRIIDAHRGDIQIQSRLGVGTCVRLWLPCAESGIGEYGR